MSWRGRLRRLVTQLVWDVGGRIPHRLRDVSCRVGSLLLYRLPLKGLANWETNFRWALGRPPTRRERRAVLDSWLRNNLMSLSLANWSRADILERAIVSPKHEARVRNSLAGPGLVLALPHMGSWDFAGAWCNATGIKVVSVAERLPAGLYERFSQARERMGMTIYPYGRPGTMNKLAEHVRAGHMVCLLSDRDMSRRGVDVPWPTDDHPMVVRVPTGPFLLAKETGADLRVVVTVFHGDKVEMLVSERIEVTTAKESMTDVVAAFAEGVETAPTSWLMMQPFFRG